MTHRFGLALLAVIALSGGTVHAAPQARPAVQESRIPFASTIRDFRADGEDVIYLRSGKQWYRGTFMSPCRELPWAWSVAFDSPGMGGGVDRFTTVVVRGERCPLDSLVRIDGQPPKKGAKPAA